MLSLIFFFRAIKIKNKTNFKISENLQKCNSVHFKILWLFIFNIFLQLYLKNGNFHYHKQ